MTEGGRVLRSLLLFVGLAIPLRAVADEGISYRFNIWNEATAAGRNPHSPFNPGNRLLGLPVWNDSFITTGEASYRTGKVRVSGAFINRFDHVSRSTDRLRLKELYAGVSLGPHWDITVGKRIVRWGVGYAWTPTGVLDPRKDPRDPGDRLSQYGGRDLVEARATFGNRSFTAVYAPAPLFSSRGRGKAEWAFKYNSLARGLDYSVVAAIGGGEPGRLGANASYVLGTSLEIHAEVLAQKGTRLSYPRAIAESDPRQTYDSTPLAIPAERSQRVYLKSLIGANYTFPGGWNVVIEYYRDGEGLSSEESRKLGEFIDFNRAAIDPRTAGSTASRTLEEANLLWTLRGLSSLLRSRDYLFLRVSRDRIARRWGLESISLFSLGDGSSAWIPQVSYDLADRWSCYVRFLLLGGGARSEYGALPVRRTATLGLSFRF